MREVTTNRPHIEIKNQRKKTCILIDVAIPVVRNITYKDSRKEKKVQEIMHRNITNVDHEIYDYTGKNGATGIATKVSKKNLETVSG